MGAQCEGGIQENFNHAISTSKHAANHDGSSPVNKSSWRGRQRAFHGRVLRAKVKQFYGGGLSLFGPRTRLREDIRTGCCYDSADVATRKIHYIRRARRNR